MAGTHISISIEDAAARAMLARLQRPDTTPLMRRIGERIQASTKDRFGEQKAPDGQPWKELSTDYAQTKPRNRHKILTLRGNLRRYIRWQADATSVQIGTNTKYAAIHQFGGTIRPKKGKALAFGGEVVSSVAIPARPYLGISTQDQQEIHAIIKEWVLEQAGE